MIQGSRVSLDASVLIAAAGSPTGGSAAAISFLGQSSVHEVFVSPEVLREALGNLRLKFDESAVVRFYTLLGSLRPILVESNQQTIESLNPPLALASKDCHVIQSCLTVEATVCLTLDRRHLLVDEVRRWGMAHQLRLLTPGEFLAWRRFRTEAGEKS